MDNVNGYIYINILNKIYTLIIAFKICINSKITIEYICISFNTLNKIDI
jgi:hypothetical protein